MASAKSLLDEKRDEILKLAALHGAANVRVFGSVAREVDVVDDGGISPYMRDRILAEARSI